MSYVGKLSLKKQTLQIIMDDASGQHDLKTAEFRCPDVT